jgi:electron transfer flavoprotein alpha subunit
MADVLVLAEHRQGRLHDATLEALAKGREVAEAVGGRAAVALLGDSTDGLAQNIAGYGLEVVQAVNPALGDYTPEGYAMALGQLVEGERPRLLLGAHTATGYEVLPYFAAVSQLPLLTDCLDLSLQGEGISARKALYNGKVVAEVEVKGGPPIVASLRPATVRPAERGPALGAIRRVEVAVDAAAIGRRVEGLQRPEVGDVDITQAEVVVAAGRGIKDKGNLKLIEDFAKALGGVVAGSRPVVDNQWLPWDRQVGSSGRTVKPKLYVACGISGATQHIAGMKGSELIIAINVDPTAPIFDVAHYGVVGDLFKVIPAVLKGLKGG